LILSAVISILLSVYAVHLWALTLLAIRRKRPPAVTQPSSWPFVSVHVPVFNEGAVVSRVLDSALAFNYPHDRLEVIVVDDSTDNTTTLLRSYERRYRGIVRIIHRDRRMGFKAGALQRALIESKGEFVALFDADQTPPSSFLQRMIPYLTSDNRIAFAQGRATYLSDGNSWVARALSLGMDCYGFVDQQARYSADLLAHFSGGGGLFRKEAIIGVGGWESETLAEDLDLSIRLRLAGWRHVYDESVPCQGEAPTSLPVLRQQQSRWASGFAGCLKKYARRLVTTAQMSRMQKVEAIVYLTGYVASPIIAVGVLLAIVYCLLFPAWFIMNGFRLNVFAAITVLASALIYTAPLAMFTLTVFRSAKGWSCRVKRVIDLAYLGVLSVGIFLTSARAVLSGLLNKATYFYRTPKRGNSAQPSMNSGG